MLVPELEPEKHWWVYLLYLSLSWGVGPPPPSFVLLSNMNLLRRYLPNRVPASPSRGGGRSRGPRLPLHTSPHPDRSGEEALLQFRLKRGCRGKWCVCAREWGFYAWKIPHSHNQLHRGEKGCTVALSWLTYNQCCGLLELLEGHFKNIWRIKQCCGSGSGMRCLLDPWIRDLGWVKDQDPGWKKFGSGIWARNTGIKKL